MLRYWSALTTLRKTPEKAVLATSETVPRTSRSKACIMLSSILVAVIAAPKDIAQRIIQMVFSMPAILKKMLNARKGKLNILLTSQRTSVST